MCALRYASLREFDDQVRIDEKRSSNFTAVDMTRVRISSRALPIQMVDIGQNCYGVIVDEDTVFTVADCTNLKGLYADLGKDNGLIQFLSENLQLTLLIWVIK